MPNTKVLRTNRTIPKLKVFTPSLTLPIHGQCVLLFTTTSDTSFTFYNPVKSDGLIVSLNQTEFSVKRISSNDRYDSQVPSKGRTEKSGAYYWFSLDSQNQRLQGGIGEPRIETVCYSYQFDPTAKLWEANKEFLESIISVQTYPELSILRVLRNPITIKVPLRVKGTHHLTMDDVASSDYLPNSMLSPASQALYNCVAGENFTLNTPDFPDFADAIEYSIRTPGLWCNTRLKQKANEFSKDPQPLETYLRITLGENNGESPGIPYVMEIWPVGHYSPIHNHSAANAVIRVLHGTIHVSLYPFLCDQEESVEPFATQDFVKDDITWISSTLNQVHMLKNLDTNTQTCITIQCYLYDLSDTGHYDYFDYLGENNAKQQYEPDSDMDFVKFKETIRNEWNARHVTTLVQSNCCLPFWKSQKSK
jgi:hypothetical protein